MCLLPGNHASLWLLALASSVHLTQETGTARQTVSTPPSGTGETWHHPHPGGHLAWGWPVCLHCLLPTRILPPGIVPRPCLGCCYPTFQGSHGHQCQPPWTFGQGVPICSSKPLSRQDFCVLERSFLLCSIKYNQTPCPRWSSDLPHPPLPRI